MKKNKQYCHFLKSLHCHSFRKYILWKQLRNEIISSFLKNNILLCFALFYKQVALIKLYLDHSSKKSLILHEIIQWWYFDENIIAHNISKNETIGSDKIKFVPSIFSHIAFFNMKLWTINVNIRGIST